MSPQSLHIGPPATPWGGMNRRLRRQQIPYPQFWMLRNVRLVDGALMRRKGLVRLFCGARTAKSLTSDGNTASYGTIAITDGSVAISDYLLETKWTVFVAYSLADLSNNVNVFGTDTAAQGILIKHLTTGKITLLVEDKAGTTTTITSTNTFKAGVEVVVQAVRDGTTVTLYVNGASEGTTSVLSSTSHTKEPLAFYLDGWVASGTSAPITYYELRVIRKDVTSHTWRVTQYPWSGTFSADPYMALHLIFEDGSGTAVTDYSRNKNTSIALAGTWTWNATTKRQVSTPVTGLHMMQTARGRKWLLADVGANHYRIPVN